MNKVRKNLYIGDASAASPPHRVDLDRVVTVMLEKQPATTDFYPLRDGEHDYEDFKSAVDTVLDALDNNETVLVHCRAGISRSAAVTIATVGTLNETRYTSAFNEVRRARRTVNPEPRLRESATRYLTRRQMERATSHTVTENQ